MDDVHGHVPPELPANIGEVGLQVGDHGLLPIVGERPHLLHLLVELGTHRRNFLLIAVDLRLNVRQLGFYPISAGHLRLVALRESRQCLVKPGHLFLQLGVPSLQPAGRPGKAYDGVLEVLELRLKALDALGLTAVCRPQRGVHFLALLLGLRLVGLHGLAKIRGGAVALGDLTIEQRCRGADGFEEVAEGRGVQQHEELRHRWDEHLRGISAR
mmetsp:Transcript_7803/g.22365  ORF Transcript_7803/g.22365 Transcript_7803/m.22365 type:complete len:214 (-) Transcript_7803:238-879(-)